MVQRSLSWALQCFSPTQVDNSETGLRVFIDSLINVQFFDAKLWGILDGLKLVQRRGDDQVIIFTYSLKVIKAIIGSSSTNSNSALIRRIHNILTQENQWSLRYTPSEHNQVADYLAKQALIGKANIQVFDIPPEGASSLIDGDKHMIATFPQ
ncbi:hypothetical protein CXB51_034000 [Gossypium anomalum]|uniref:RNase H type-1 domain-containing protein n=1 Tax=Gossypium anomalum TaxID=47600 RepID=A0A8J6CIS8_9ROSI|nr:hypothetical protein CXB51_034000 [Gossypium anomalum]